MPKQASARARRWTLTFNNTKPDMEALEAKPEFRFMIIGEEKAPTTGQLHWQGYVELKKPVRLTQLKTLLDDEKVHAQVSKGTAQQNIDYCSKDGKIEQFGTANLKGQGARTDIYALYEYLKEGKSVTDALEEGAHIGAIARHPKFANMVEMVFTPDRTEMTELYIYWGPTHTGKSHTAFEEAKLMGPVYHKPAACKWWDGYNGQPCVILEDFRGEIPLAQMLRLCDKYPMQVQTKGGFKKFNSKRIYITSNTDVDDWFNQQQKGYDASIAAFKRRITKKMHFVNFFKLPTNKNQDN